MYLATLIKKHRHAEGYWQYPHCGSYFPVAADAQIHSLGSSNVIAALHGGAIGRGIIGFVNVRFVNSKYFSSQVLIKPFR